MLVNWRVLKAFIKKELGQSLRDPRMRTLLFIAPCIQMTLFGLALRNEVRNVKLAVYAEPNDTVTWSLAHRAEGTNFFRIVEHGSERPFELIRAGKADAALVAPAGGLTQEAGRGHGEAQLLVDGANTVRAQGVSQYFEQVRAAEQA